MLWNIEIISFVDENLSFLYRKILLLEFQEIRKKKISKYLLDMFLFIVLYNSLS